MIHISHRVNNSKELLSVPEYKGIEVDVRDYDGELVLAHDPWVCGESFEQFLSHYKHRLLIVNVKCEGIELPVLNILRKLRITNFFFLDCSFPAIVKLISIGCNSLALRLSEYESISSIESMKHKIEWVWVDCFTRPGIDVVDLNILRAEMPFLKTCIVSPDLHGRPEEIDAHKTYYEQIGFKFDAVCSKSRNSHLWE